MLKRLFLFSNVYSTFWLLLSVRFSLFLPSFPCWKPPTMYSSQRIDRKWLWQQGYWRALYLQCYSAQELWIIAHSCSRMSGNWETLPFLSTLPIWSETWIISPRINVSNSNKKPYQKYKSHPGLKAWEMLCSEILLVPAFGHPTPDRC